MANRFIWSKVVRIKISFYWTKTITLTFRSLSDAFIGRNSEFFLQFLGTAVNYCAEKCKKRSFFLWRPLIVIEMSCWVWFDKRKFLFLMGKADLWVKSAITPQNHSICNCWSLECEIWFVAFICSDHVNLLTGNCRCTRTGDRLGMHTLSWRPHPRLLYKCFCAGVSTVASERVNHVFHNYIALDVF